MASSSICLSEPLQHEDVRSWFKHFTTADEWDAAKWLLCLPTLLQGQLWAIYESLSNDGKETYVKLKKAVFDRLNPNTGEHCLAT